MYLTSDPSGNRFKVFHLDKTFKTPGRYGKIYDFNSKKVLAYDHFKQVCEAYEIEDINTAPFLQRRGQGFKYFQAQEQAWADPAFGKTQYLGQVKVMFDKNDYYPEPDIYHLFMNNIQFFDAELDFEQSNRDARTLYFLSEKDNWRPDHVI